MKKLLLISALITTLFIAGCVPDPDPTCAEVCEEKGMYFGQCDTAIDDEELCFDDEVSVGLASDCGEDENYIETCCCRTTKRPHDVDSWNTSGSEILETYAAYIKDADAKLENNDIRCFEQPTVGEINFTSLNIKRQLYRLYSDCRIDRCLHPGCSVPYWFYYTDDTGKQVVLTRTHKGFEDLEFKEAEKLEDHFSELFKDLETEDELLEYIDFSPAARTLSLLDEVFADWHVSLDDCEFEQEAPEVTELISQNEDGFIYEGFFIDPEHIIKLYYFKYSITPDGKITEHDRTVLAECGRGVDF